MANPLADPKLNLATLRAIARELERLRRCDHIKQGSGISIVRSKEGIVINAGAKGGS